MKNGGLLVASTALVVIFSCRLMQCPALAQAQDGSTESFNPGGKAPDPTTVLPPANACQSRYDRFYETEPGVYAYWPLCETGAPPQIYDYVGEFDLTRISHAWGGGTLRGGLAGPVADAETAVTTATDNASVESQGIPMNSHQGTVAAWILIGNIPSPSERQPTIPAEATDNANGDRLKLRDPRRQLPLIFLNGVKKVSGISIGFSTEQEVCFAGEYVDSAGTKADTRKCGFKRNAWHRVVFTWRDGRLHLYLDGDLAAQGTYTGILDNSVFYYRLFPACCNDGMQTALAKVAVANEAWSDAQVAADERPIFAVIPEGGVLVTANKLGTIHRDVLGYGDSNQDISTPAVREALLSGLRAAGVTSVRYGGGYGGIDVDLADWQGGGVCGHTPHTPGRVRNLTTADTIDNFFPEVVKPLALDVVVTANYSTNPPFCDAGGDPEVNGGKLVQYANQTKGYRIRNWEVGNEVFSHPSEADFHPNPNSGASYVQYEPAFYSAMKAKDPSIKIAVPIGLAIYSWQTEFDLPVLAGASYDAIVWHNYPMRDPITDGATLYQDRVAAAIDRTHGALLKLQTELLNNGKRPDAIWITEWNGEVAGNKWSRQTIGAVEPLFVTTQLAEYMQAGVEVATWWAQGQPNGCSTFNYDGQGETAYSWWKCGATGLVYAGPTRSHGEVAIGIRPGDLLPAGRAFQILSQSGFVTEGEHMLRTESECAQTPWLMSYAATHGALHAVILINRDRNNAHRVPVTISGFARSGKVEQWSYGREQYDQSAHGDWSASPKHFTFNSDNGSVQATLQPWSVNVLVF